MPSSPSLQDLELNIDFKLLNKQLSALMEGESDVLAISANFVGLLFAEIPNINWLGIYIKRENELVLGPFQGLPACVRIPLGQGVCGTAATQGQTLRVDHVHDFAGHIACDPNSESELVVPLIANGAVFAVLDIDSPHKARFSEDDQAGVEKLCHQFVQKLNSIRADLQNFI